MGFKMFYKLRTFHDSETHLLLAAPIYFKTMRASKRFLMEFVSHLGKKLLLPELLDWICRIQRK